MTQQIDLILEIANIQTGEEKGYTLKTKQTHFGFTKTVVEVKTQKAQKFLNKKAGHYITLDGNFDYVQSKTVKQNIIIELQEAITELMKQSKVEHPKKVLVVGLGNKQLVSDSLGPKTIEKIVVTRHIKEVMNENLDSVNSISAIATGVLGTTGIETADIVTAVCKEVKPEVVVLIDTLSTLQINRIATSFQLTNTGIVPGGGVGNHRAAIDKNLLGVPTIVIGMPLVTYAYAMCKEVIEKVTDNIENISHYETKLKQVANSMLGDLVVTIKDIDQVVDVCADIIASSINKAVNPNL
jgi:spore protease